MKKAIFLILTTVMIKFGFAQGDLSVIGTFFTPSTIIAVNQTTNFKSEFLNVDFANPITLDPDPANRFYVLISTSSNFYVPSPIGPGAITGDGASYFDWTVMPDGTTLLGTLNKEIPPGAGGAIIVNIKGIQQSGGTAFQSSIEFQDPGFAEGGAGLNTGTATLTVTNPLAVSYTDINASKNNCDVKVSWANSSESNLVKYEIEASKNGRDYMKVGETVPTNARQYTSVFTINDQIAANIMYVRIKAIDKDNKGHYSSIVTVNGTCSGSGAWEINAYPVPVKKESFITLNAKSGVFNGKYSLQVVDKSGRQISNSEVTLSNSKTYKFDLNKSIASGKYFLKINNKDGSQSTTLPIEVL